MSNILDANGLQTDSYQDIIDRLTSAYKSIYGDDINLDSDTPDGQILGTFAQATIDNLELIVAVYNSFDPDLAIGVTLDQRVAINGIQRQAGTHTVTPIDVETDRAVNLNGLDNMFPGNPTFTVADDAGTNWQLIASQSIGGAGTYTLSFQAENPGKVLTTLNTITTMVTIILGVVAVNNPSTFTTLGIDEESDFDLRIRRQKSTAISSKGYFDSLLAALENIPGVTAAFVYENVTGTTDGDGVPGHSIWVIVAGGANTDIANVIYSKRNAGCGMKGAVTYNVTQLDNSIFQVKWDIVVTEALYIKFDAHSINGIDAIDSTYIKNQIASRLIPGVHATLDINEIATLVQQIDPNCLVTNAGLSFDGFTYVNIITNSAKNKRFTISTANIAITVV